MTVRIIGRKGVPRVGIAVRIIVTALGVCSSHERHRATRGKGAATHVCRSSHRATRITRGASSPPRRRSFGLAPAATSAQDLRARAVTYALDRPWRPVPFEHRRRLTQGRPATPRLWPVAPWRRRLRMTSVRPASPARGLRCRRTGCCICARRSTRCAKRCCEACRGARSANSRRITQAVGRLIVRNSAWPYDERRERQRRPQSQPESGAWRRGAHGASSTSETAVLAPRFQPASKRLDHDDLAYHLPG